MPCSFGEACERNVQFALGGLEGCEECERVSNTICTLVELAEDVKNDETETCVKWMEVCWKK